MFSVIPGALALLNGIILLFYPLNTARTEKMHLELKAKREAETTAGH
jgi:Na+/melibiose symporter-like transporter